MHKMVLRLPNVDTSRNTRLMTFTKTYSEDKWSHWHCFKAHWSLTTWSFYWKTNVGGNDCLCPCNQRLYGVNVGINSENKYNIFSFTNMRIQKWIRRKYTWNWFIQCGVMKLRKAWQQQQTWAEGEKNITKDENWGGYWCNSYWIQTKNSPFERCGAFNVFLRRLNSQRTVCWAEAFSENCWRLHMHTDKTTNKTAKHKQLSITYSITSIV